MAENQTKKQDSRKHLITLANRVQRNITNFCTSKGQYKLYMQRILECKLELQNLPMSGKCGK